MNKIKRKDGFTMIEILTVLSIIAILVLLATPKFMGYAKKASLIQIRNDVKAAEKTVDVYLLEHGDYPEDWLSLDRSGMDTMISEKIFYSIKGQVSEVTGQSFHVLPKEYITKATSTRLDGLFISDEGGTVYYVDDEVPGVPGNVIDEVAGNPFGTLPVPYPGYDETVISGELLKVTDIIYPSGYYKNGETATTKIVVQAIQTVEAGYMIDYYTSLTSWEEYCVPAWKRVALPALEAGESFTLPISSLIDTASFGYVMIDIALRNQAEELLYASINYQTFYILSPEWKYYKVPELVKGATNETIGGLGGVSPTTVSISDNGDGINIAKVVINSPVGSNVGGMAVTPYEVPYGSYEARMLTSASDSMLHGFFLYGDENHEIDIEILKDPITGRWSMWTTIHNETHPDYAILRAGIPDLEPGEIYKKKIDLDSMGINPTTYNDYRIDYYPTYVHFSVNGIIVSEWNHSFDYGPMSLHASAFYTHWLKKDFSETDTLTVMFIRTKNIEEDLYHLYR